MPAVTRSPVVRLLTHYIAAGFVCILISSQSLLAQTPPAEHESADRQISFVIDQLRVWRDSFQSIRLTTHQTRTTNSRRRPLRPGTVNLPLTEPVVQEDTTTLWYENRFRFHSLTESRIASKLTYRRRNAVDGFRYWIALSSPDDPEQFESITLMPLQPVASPKIKFSSVHPLQHQTVSRILDGLWHNAECCWVSEWIHRTEHIESLGRELVNGRTCIVLKITPGSAIEATANRTSKWWFDLEAGCIPVRKEWSNQAEAPSEESLPERDIWEAAKIEEIRDGFWFPRSGTIRYERNNPDGSGIQTHEDFWTVDSVVLDEKIPEELLIVPARTLRTKTFVNDFQLTTPETETPETIAEASTPNPSPESSAILRPAANSWLSFRTVAAFMAAISLPVLLIAFRSVQRRFRKAH
ncbi:MAG: hypothetical protein JNL58_05375 [Planctomyces sp.]|nr:hypothetical protein [Planctomyces sp.]